VWWEVGAMHAQFVAISRQCVALVATNSTSKGVCAFKKANQYNTSIFSDKFKEERKKNTLEVVVVVLCIAGALGVCLCQVLGGVGGWVLVFLFLFLLLFFFFFLLLLLLMCFLSGCCCCCTAGADPVEGIEHLYKFLEAWLLTAIAIHIAFLYCF